MITTIFSYELFATQQREYLKGIDSKLYTAAIMAKAIVQPNYHNKIIDQSSVLPERYLKIVDTYNKLCVELGLQYIWSNIVLEDKIVFTTSTSPSKDIGDGGHALFFEIHTDSSSFSDVQKSKTISYSSFKNKWGHGRMVLVPFYDNMGRMYVFGASASIDELSQIIAGTRQRILIVLFFVLIFGTSIVLLVSHFISSQILRLTKVTERIAAGE